MFLRMPGGWLTITFLLITVLLVSCTAIQMQEIQMQEAGIVAQPQQADGLAASSTQFDQAAFANQAKESFDGIVKGYSLAVARNGVIVGSASGGIAVDVGDALFPIATDGSTPVNVGSTAKMVSAIALLSFFEKEPTATVDQWLDRKIIAYFPKSWRDELLTSGDPWKLAVGQVTFRHLLQHKTGLEVRNCDTCRISSTFLNGVNPNAVGQTREYANFNIKILSYILPYMVDPEFGDEVDAKAVSQDIDVSENEFYQSELATHFGRYMQSEIFDKVLVHTAPKVVLPEGLWKERLVPSCDHKTSYAGTPYFRDEQWGIAGDIPLSGDVNGDGIDDFVIWRPANGEWFARSVDGTVIRRELSWGNEGDIPLVGDVNGDARDDFVIWRPTTGEWFARAANGTVLKRDLQWGLEGDIPLVGDVNGDARDDFVIWRPTTGEWFARTANGAVLKRDLQWGLEGDIPLVGDVNGDGVDEFVIFRPTSNRWFAIKINGDVLFRQVRWGQANVTGNGSLIPLVQDMSGDAKANLVVYRPQSGHWSAAGRRYALGYSSKDATGPGTPAENRPELPGCYAQGGYWFSSLEYIGWAARFGHGNTFVSQSVRDMLFDASTDASMDDRLGWASVFDTQKEDFPFVMDDYGIRYLPYHDGADHQFRSVFIQLPDGYYGFGAINSTDRNSRQVARSILRAWIAAMGG